MRSVEMLSAKDLKGILEFTVFVDRFPATKARLLQAESLSEVADVAKLLGFGWITPTLLFRATGQLESNRWIWENHGKQWASHLAALPLHPPRPATATHLEHGSTPLIGDEARRAAFYAYTKRSAAIREQLRQARHIQDVIGIAREHGFLLQPVDCLIHKREWNDRYFPWHRMGTNERRGFMHGLTRLD
jgi:hypothetical protein